MSEGKMSKVPLDDEAKVIFTTGLGAVLGEAVISKVDLDLFRFIGKVSKNTCINIEVDGYIEHHDDHSQIKPCSRTRRRKKK